MRGGEKILDAIAMRMHRDLAEYHRDLASKTRVTLLYHYHSDLASRLNHEADQIQDRIVLEEEDQWPSPPT